MLGVCASFTEGYVHPVSVIKIAEDITQWY
jgi:hypothetical protein